MEVEYAQVKAQEGTADIGYRKFFVSKFQSELDDAQGRVLDTLLATDWKSIDDEVLSTNLTYGFNSTGLSASVKEEVRSWLERGFESTRVDSAE